MEVEPRHATGRAIRAARAWKGLSRAQLGQAVDRDGATIGRWERGDWKRDAPAGPLLAAIGQLTGAEVLGIAGELLSSDPATRFAAQARVEAQRQRERRRQADEGLPVEDVEGGAR